ncbi:MAG: HEPN domain-containing protein [Acidobacteria bacterium]|nr:HEPN domain-containing protein [Acidobacteriota bacterium]
MLYGVSIDKPVAVEGIRIVKLASASNELIGRLPPSLVEMHGYRDILGGVLLVADAEYGPILHAVDGASSDYKWAHGSTKRESPADDFCEALSLACNGGVGLSYRWREFGELQGFNPGSSYESRRDVGGPTVGLSQEQLEEALKVYRARYRDKRLDTAIRQWVRSKRARSLADRSIDLRIALETLYLHGREWSEYRFRLANYGAWHLGKDVKERKEIRTAFKKAYDVCSKAVHEGSVEAKEEPSLVEAQNLCRRAILERLADRKTPVWDDLILGA